VASAYFWGIQEMRYVDDDKSREDLIAWYKERGERVAEERESTREEAVDGFKKRMERDREDEIKKKQRDLQMNRFLKFLKKNWATILLITFLAIGFILPIIGCRLLGWDCSDVHMYDGP